LTNFRSGRACARARFDPQANYIKRIKEAVASGKLAPPILYHKKFYEDGDALRAVHPKLTCII